MTCNTEAKDIMSVSEIILHCTDAMKRHKAGKVFEEHRATKHHLEELIITKRALRLLALELELDEKCPHSKCDVNLCNGGEHDIADCWEESAMTQARKEYNTSSDGVLWGSTHAPDNDKFQDSLFL